MCDQHFAKTLPGVVLALLLAACGGNGGEETEGGGNVGASAPVSRVDPATGQLRHHGEAAAGAGPYSVSVDPAGKFAYVANETANTISVYRIDPGTGALTPVGVPVFAPHPRSITIERSGKFVYAEHKNPNTVSVYRIDAATGALKSLGTVRNRARAFPSTPTKGGSAVAYTPKYAYLGNLNSSQVPAYRLDASTTDTETAGTDPGSITMSRKIERH